MNAIFALAKNEKSFIKLAPSGKVIIQFLIVNDSSAKYARVFVPIKIF